MISIVIPVFNQHDMTTECIESIKDNTSMHYEIVIVDNGSDPPFNPPFLGFSAGAMIRNEENLGFPKAINLGIRAAKGDVIIILNNDVVVTPGWAEQLTAWLENFAIVGPLTNYCAGLQRTVLPTYTNRDELDKEAEALADEGEAEEVNFVIGFCMAFKKSLYDEVGEFDESLWPCSGEEIDFCLRARASGHSIGIAHDVYVHHFGSQTFTAMEEAGQLNYDNICKRNDAHLAKKYGPDFWLHQAVISEGDDNG